jgi:dTDP-4-amino-4,6-dideoxygalactose transaminase
VTLKKDVADLALFGGTPAFVEPLHVGRPALIHRRRFLDRVEDILDHHWYTNNGRYVQELEERIAALLGVAHCVAVSNGTAALELALRAGEVAGEVIVPSFTFIATAHALTWQGIRPVFADVDPASHNLDPRQAEALITPATTAILGVHLWGRPCAIAELSQLAADHNLRLLFDAAHAFTCSWRGQMIGRFGDAEVFSFHATKFFNTVEGGAIVTGNGDLARRARLMRNFGFSGYDEVVGPGTNAKMNEMSAAMGLTLLEELDELIEANRHRYHLYRREFTGLPGLSLVTYDESESANYQYLVVEIDEAAAGLSRDGLLEVLWAENVWARRYFYPGCHRMEPYRSQMTLPPGRLAATDQVAKRVMVLPTGINVSPGDVELVGELIRLALGHGSEVSRRLSARAAGS